MESSDLLKFLPVIKNQKQSLRMPANRQFQHTKVKLLTYREDVDGNLSLESLRSWTGLVEQAS